MRANVLKNHKNDHYSFAENDWAEPKPPKMKMLAENLNHISIWEAAILDSAIHYLIELNI